jgi:ferric-dicitrate binding protein FerR (iron transport regulator)
MTTRSDHELQAALWDPGAPAPPELRRIVEVVAPLRFDIANAPLGIERRARRSWFSPTRLAALGMAAAVALLFGLAVFRWDWPEGRSWPMTVVTGEGSSRAARLEVGRELYLGPGETARLRVARIGAMEVGAGTTLTLRATAANQHRLVLTRGTVRARVWAPPASVVIKTPAGDVIDLGCRFRLSVDGDSRARVSVESGWVQLDNVAGETLVPAGASSEMAPGVAPLVPIFDDAAVSFRAGVRDFEVTLRTDASPARALGFLAEATERDVITLLGLARAAPPGARRALLERASTLSPPPSGVRVDAIVGGEREALWRWQDALDLPPPKSWWLHWRDGFEGLR